VADAAAGLREVYRQEAAAVRFDWGPIGAAAIAPGADVVVVVDVLSFTTTLSVAIDLGVEVFPYRLRDASAAAFAASKSAVLAVGRAERTAGGVSLSPLSVRTAAAAGGELATNPRLVLPSPNGSAICRQLAETGTTVVGACLRNAPAVARWIRRQGFDVVGVVAAGERWPGDLLRPAVEDLWGAGAVIAGLTGSSSPEAGAAAAAWSAVAGAVGVALADCGSGRELAADGWGDEVPVAAEVGLSDAVPVLSGDSFKAA
jgi:2-phosphosulfolactate phosphatase